MVLAGAAALGAYEAGVLSYLANEVRRDVPLATPDVVSGTSAGAINAMALAAFSDDPAMGARIIVREWTELRIGQFIRPSSVELLSMLLDLTGAPLRVRRALQAHTIRGGLLDPRPIMRLIDRIPLRRIDDHLTSGRLRGVAVVATRVSTGTATIFHHGTTPVRPWREPNVLAIATPIMSAHVAASAAIPLLFPTVRIDGDKYCDGGLRQMVPLSPAIHLGSNRLLVVSPLPVVTTAPAPTPTDVVSPLYLVGKALNALFADRVEMDLERLDHTTEILRAGTRRFGPSFEHEINLELARGGGGELRAIDVLNIQPSVDLGEVAAAHVKSPAFEASAPGLAGKLLRRIADGDPERAGDLLAYLLFDGSFTSILIDQGRADARARHDELCALFAPR